MRMATTSALTFSKITQYHLDDKYMIDGLAIKNLSSGKMVYTFIPEGFEKPRKRAVDITRYECIIPDIGKYARSKTPLKKPLLRGTALVVRSHKAGANKKMELLSSFTTILLPKNCLSVPA